MMEDPSTTSSQTAEQTAATTDIPPSPSEAKAAPSSPASPRKSPRRSPNSPRMRGSGSPRMGETQRSFGYTRSSSPGSPRSSTLRSKSGDIHDDDIYHSCVVERFSRSPGPKYNVETAMNQTFHRSMTTKFSKDDREKYFTKTSTVPGPVYNPSDTTTSTRPRSPSPSFSRGERDTGMIMKTPFSGKYHDAPDPSVTSKVSKAPSPSFSHEDRAKHFVRTTPNPGPGTYQPPSAIGVKKTFNVRGGSSSQPRDTTEWCFTSR
ncbi:uncharacterized protein MONOS_3704 [Monocercomonoides exilis]|uniref:uncharacterized protein n=1 Tax=Monocercomonoides exilis TaxID=2049356 RepID=UPI00355A0BC5|nr:hypothetical protein MONOS_3704 [Monocercomonoides exilis]|eukprot:MONOS_3703.2-p1 / transcript=MONOS_3703.2 / gene=MONOS_3703 / organism=Monocercomonoides_exilis_PA203 / gene_product=unspecified product / transcript_product=unspecified product / location=Mono_scaffold00090:26876-28029(+) / protein_length=262 / sequence_SO=supercontig / SO=protein_coding / is_pseudo=false